MQVFANPRGTQIEMMVICANHLNFAMFMHRKTGMYANLLLRLRNKLLYWDTTNLSLPGRVVVANSVLLASMWYVALAWLFSRSIILKLQRLVRNFIWGASLGSRVVAKVAWSVLIRPKREGGPGLIDPMLHSKALLAKHVVRGFMPRDELWKKLWLSYLDNIKPTIGGTVAG